MVCGTEGTRETLSGMWHRGNQRHQVSVWHRGNQGDIKWYVTQREPERHQVSVWHRRDQEHGWIKFFFESGLGSLMITCRSVKIHFQLHRRACFKLLILSPIPRPPHYVFYVCVWGGWGGDGEWGQPKLPAFSKQINQCKVLACGPEPASRQKSQEKK